MSALIATAQAHSGVVTQRTHPELYDIATFALAVIVVIIVRRALRKRFARRRDQQPPRD